MSLYMTSVLTNICLISFLALSAYLVLLVGELSFGQQAFFGIGAYVAGTATTVFESGIIVALLAATILGALCATLLATLTLRLTGIFFSISTLAFAELFRFAMLQVRFTKEREGQIFGPDGPEGFENIRWAFDQNISTSTFLIVIAAILFATVICLVLAERTRFFRSARMVGEDPILAQTQGLRPEFYRIAIIALAGGMAAFGGGLFAHHSTYVEPAMFSIMIGVHSLAYAVLGGLASPLGPLLGAILDIGLLESIRGISSYRMIVFGGLIAVFLIILPQGILNPRSMRGLKHLLRWRHD